MGDETEVGISSRLLKILIMVPTYQFFHLLSTYHESNCAEGLIYWVSPGGSDGKQSTCNVGDLALTPGLGRPPGEGSGYPLQYSGLENSMDRIVDGLTKSRTQLCDFHSFHRV